jgi:branched-chain amino acid transport system ATP-binding protein
MLPVLRRLADDGVAIIVVEQSVNLALEIAERAYFMERGEIRFSGPTRDLLDRPDLLRSIFLAGAAAGSGGPRGDGDGPPDQAAVTGDTVLAVSNVHVRFGGVEAVADVSLVLHEREVVGLIGPNGAGKTTLFDLISGFTAADRGRIALHGYDIGGLSAPARARRGLGRSFQSARMFPELTVSENLSVAQQRWIELHGVATAALHLPRAFDSEQAIARRTSELIELLGLSQYRHQMVRELSTGTRRVVDLACLVAHRPTVILLDEPTSGIAQREVEALAPVVRRLRDDMGAALFVIDHDLPFLTEICDRLVAMDRGQIIATGVPDDVLADPAVIESYLGRTAAAVARSGATTSPRTTDRAST